MYIDLHCHTKQSKSNEATTRIISKEVFIEKVSDKGVKIVALTNHNEFDLHQFIDFANNDRFIVWPGIELDVEGEVSKGHCIVIADPKNAEQFEQSVRSITQGKHPDHVCVKYTDLVTTFKDQDVIFIAHYGRKKPSLNEEDYILLRDLCKDKIPLFIEVQNLRSAGIMISYNKSTLIGSDIIDWDKYQQCDLPELKFELDSFHNFMLAIKKDPKIIKSFVDKIYSERITIKPFEDLTLNLDIYQDLNIIIGGKGTGKTRILHHIEDYYKGQGTKGISTYYIQERDHQFKEITKQSCELDDFKKLDTQEDKEHFNTITNWAEINVTSMLEYKDWAKSKDKLQYKKSFGFIKANFNEFKDESKYKDKLSDFLKISANAKKILEIDYSIYLEEKDSSELTRLLNLLIAKSKKEVVKEFSAYWGLCFEEKTIKIMKVAFEMNQGISTIPSSTGFIDVFQQSFDVMKACRAIIENLDSGSFIERKPIGTLPGKGRIYLQKEISVNPDSLNKDSIFYKPQVKVSYVRSIKNKIKSLSTNVFKVNRANEIKTLNDELKVSNICTSSDLFGINSQLVKEDGTPCSPSNGEQSMLVLSYSLVDNDKNVYILDEPENSVGHNYINSVIIPRLKELSNLKKKVIISTHDANIAIRTLPCQTIYREDVGNDKYITYFGSPFLDQLVDCLDNDNTLNWADISLDTLEGGKKAFNERGEIYGDNAN